LQAIQQLELEDIVSLTYNISEADAVITLHSKLKKNSQIQAVVKSQDIPVFFVKVSLQHTCHLQDTVNIQVPGILIHCIGSLFFADKLPVSNHTGTSCSC
jgi:hypothetical protein